MYQLAGGFSRQHRITKLPTTATRHLSGLMERGFACAPHRLTPGHPSPGTATPSCVTPSLDYYQPGSHAAPRHTRPRRKRWWARSTSPTRHWARIHGYGNINPLSIDYACRPRLRSRLTQGGLAWPWNPWSFGGQVSHLSFATHACILTPTPSTAVHTTASMGAGPPLPTHTTTHTPVGVHGCICVSAAASGGVLEPRYIVGAGPLDQ